MEKLCKFWGFTMESDSAVWQDSDLRILVRQYRGRFDIEFYAIGESEPYDSLYDLNESGLFKAIATEQGSPSLAAEF